MHSVLFLLLSFWLIIHYSPFFFRGLFRNYSRYFKFRGRFFHAFFHPSFCLVICPSGTCITLCANSLRVTFQCRCASITIRHSSFSIASRLTRSGLIINIPFVRSLPGFIRFFVPSLFQVRRRTILGCIFTRSRLIFETKLWLPSRLNKSGGSSFHIHLYFGVTWGACRFALLWWTAMGMNVSPRFPAVFRRGLFRGFSASYWLLVHLVVGGLREYFTNKKWRQLFPYQGHFMALRAYIHVWITN